VGTDFQRRFSVNVWCGVIDDMVIDPVVLDDRMTGQSYLDFSVKSITRTTRGCSFG
jgi:hypothetical protein